MKSKFVRGATFALGMLSSGSAMAETPKHHIGPEDGPSRIELKQGDQAKTPEKSKYEFAKKYTEREKQQISDYLDAHYEALKKLPRKYMDRLIARVGIEKAEKMKERIVSLMSAYRQTEKADLDETVRQLKDPNATVELSGDETVEDALKIYIMDFEVKNGL